MVLIILLYVNNNHINDRNDNGDGDEPVSINDDNTTNSVTYIYCKSFEQN